MAKFEGAGSNFLVATAGQTNGFFLPEVYSKKIQNFFRKASVVEAITNSDYTGEIASFGDTVNIVKEPVITTYEYTRGANTTKTVLTDQELVLVVDQARAFKFVVDDIEKKMSHLNFAQAATSSAAYALKDHMDAAVMSHIAAQTTEVIGADDATGGTLADIDGGATESVLIGFGTGKVDPLDVLSRAARILDEANVPEEGRWFCAAPQFYEVLSESASKLLSVDYNAGQGSIRNGLVTSGLLRGFSMYKSNNMPSGTNAEIALAGHISAVATAQTMLNVETLRDQDSFGDIVRGLHVYGRKVLRPEALIKIFWNVTTDA